MGCGGIAAVLWLVNLCCLLLVIRIQKPRSWAELYDGLVNFPLLTHSIPLESDLFVEK